MQLVDFSLRRRVTVAMAAVALVLFGLVSFTRLKISLLPELSYPTLTVETRFDGAAPSEVEQLLTRPIEERIGVVSGARRVSSVSSPGMSRVVVEFGWGRDMDFAVIDVREKLDSLRLPDGAEPPTLVRFDPGADPVMRLFLVGELDLYALRKLAEDTVEKDLESAEGVAAIEVRGGLEDEIEIQFDEPRLAALGLSISEAAGRIAAANVDQAGGSLYEREARYLVRTQSRLVSLEDIRETVLRDVEGRRVTVADVAEVRRGHAPRRTITRRDGVEAIELAIYEEGDANTTSVAAAVHARLEQIRKRLPDGVRLDVAVDQSRFIQSAVDEVSSSALFGAGFAVLVLLAFLRDLRSTMIVAVAIPISVVATFFCMHQSSTTLNVMSLGGLALGVGMLVDSAIVVLEAIAKHREQGMSPVAAARAGASEVGRAVVASTATTLAVFVPVVFLEGLAAQLFGDMALTVCFSLVVSLAVSLTLIPMMSAMASVEPEPRANSRLARILAWPLWLIRALVRLVIHAVGLVLRPFGAVFDAVLGTVERRYPRMLVWALRRPALVLVAALATFGGSMALAPRLGLDLVPSMSRGEFAVMVELPRGTPLERTDRVLADASSALRDDAAVASHASVAGEGAAAGGGTDDSGEHAGRIEITMTPEATSHDEERVVSELRRRFEAIPGARVDVVQATSFSLRDPIEVELYGDDLDQLEEVGRQVSAALASVPGVVHARSSAEQGSPELDVRFDRRKLAARGLDVETVAAVVRHKLQGEATSRFREGDREIDLRTYAIGREGASFESIRRMVVGQSESAVIRLEDVAEVMPALGPGEIHRVGQNRAAIVSADVRGRDMGAVARDIEARLDALELPPGVTAELAGQEREMFGALGALGFAVALAAFLVYLVMASQFESFGHPLVVMLTLPLGAVGVVTALWLTKTPLSVISMVGVVMLAGIVVNNAIVLVDAVNRLRAEGVPRYRAIVAGSRSRLRPILMTTATTVLGLLPMAAGIGDGAELRRSLGIAVVGGLTVATLLTLVVVPVVYALIDRKDYRTEDE